MTEHNLPPQPPSLEKTPVTPPNLPPQSSLSTNIPTDAYGNPLPQLLVSPRKCAAGAGMSWISKAFNLFKAEPLLWIGMFAAMLALFFIVGFIPVVGQIVAVSGFIFLGGIIQGCAIQAQGGELRFDHLFAGFKTHCAPLLILSLLYLVAAIIAMIPMFIVLGTVVFSMLAGDISSINTAMSAGSLIGLSLAYLVSLALLIPVLMAIWFAPSLIVLHDIAPIKAMKMSFKGCLKNILPMFVYGLIGTFALPLILIFTLGLGVFVVFPVMFITYYTSYRDVWTDQPLSGS